MWLEKYSLKPDSDFISHLDELRRRLLFCLIVFTIAAITSYCFSTKLLEFLVIPLHRFQQVDLFFHKPYEAFLTHIKISALAALIISSPVLFTQMWLFVAPGLYDREKRTVFPLTIISVALFLIGAAFAYYIVTPWGLHFLLSFSSETLKPIIGIGPYFSFLIGMILAFGILFDFPIILLGLIKLGVTSTRTLGKSRKIIILLIFIAAAVLTPSPDPISQLMLAAPLMFLFEITLLIGKVLEKRR